MTVYADVLVVVNYIVNLLVLLAAAKILGAVTARLRICCGALIGAAGSLVIFLPFYGFAFQIIYKLLLSFAMTAAAFGAKPLKRLMKSLFVTFAVSFIMAGFMLVLSFALEPAGMLFYNGVVYFDISALLLVGTTAAAYLMILLFERLFFSRVADAELYDLTVNVSGKTVTLKALADTGSSLKEPFSGAPVIVCDRGIAERICPEDDMNFRVIPCLTVTGEGALRGFRPDGIVISGGGKEIITSDVYIAYGKQDISGEYQALMNPQIINRG